MGEREREKDKYEERPGFDGDRKKDRGGKKRETGIGETDRQREVGKRDRGSHRERKIKRKIGVRERETGMG